MYTINSLSRKIFLVVNTIFLIIIGTICVLPLVHVLAVSLSGRSAASAGWVTLWPIDFNTTAYTFLLNRPAFWRAMLVTIQRVLLGGSINLILTVLCAYPLSKTKAKFRARGVYVWILFFTMLFSGGLIPGFILVFNLGMIDTLWSLVLPGAVPVFSVILMLNFFRQIPSELEEAAAIDGAGHWKTLFQVYIPCSLPSIATIALFSIVHHWNSWFDGMIFSNFPESYPLQTYLRAVIMGVNFTQIAGDDWRILAELSDRTIRSAQIFIGSIPILAVYPFLQKYFVKGITIGSVKG